MGGEKCNLHLLLRLTPPLSHPVSIFPSRYCRGISSCGESSLTQTLFQTPPSPRHPSPLPSHSEKFRRTKYLRDEGARGGKKKRRAGERGGSMLHHTDNAHLGVSSWI